MGTFKLATLLGTAAAPRINIVDVGAMALEGVTNEYSTLVKDGVGHVIGFEPVQEECDKLNRTSGKHQTFLPYFIGDGNEGEFKQCAATMTSSLLEPNLPLLRKFFQLEELTTPIKRTKVQTKRLDDIAEVASIDFLKTDVQGAELMVFRGATEKLRNAVVIQTEVEFHEMYIGQPLFGDIDAELRAQGFVIHGAGAGAGRAFKPICPGGDPSKRFNQLLWNDVIYVRDFMRFTELSPDQLLKIAVIMNDCYLSVDLASLALQHYDAKTGKGLWKIYTQRLTGTSITPPPLD